ncbi:MAG: GGDEF domain-containing protein [Candidatus Nanopelagicales bacterium]
MGESSTPTEASRLRGQILLAVIMPLSMTALILAADVVEGPKTAFVGVLTAVPMVVAVFGSGAQVALVGLINWSAAFIYGQFAADGHVPAQSVRLVIISLMTLLAFAVARIRVRRDADLQLAWQTAVTHQELARLSQIDDLTGLPNRRGGMARVGELSRRDGVGETRERTVAIIDCDLFKQVNDQHGHHVGDEFLKAMAGRLSHAVSAGDVVARWGGDEFFLVLDTPLRQALPVLERLREAAVGPPIQTAAGPLPGSISVGAAVWPAGEELARAVRQADAALYLAKRSGRNRVCSADDLAADELLANECPSRVLLPGAFGVPSEV